MSIQHIPARGRMVDANGVVTPEWLAWFRLLSAAETTPTTTTPTTGSGSSSSGSTSSGGTSGTVLSPSGVAAGIYGDEDNVPQITVDEYGRITHAINVAIAGGGGVTPHDLLSNTHPDTEVASPSAGDMIVARDNGAPDVGLNWYQGRAFPYLPTDRILGNAKYWFKGLAAKALTSTSGTVKWARKANGTPGYVWTAGATGPDWQPPSSGSGVGAGAFAYQSGDVSVAGGPFGAIVPVQISFGATDYDDASFWSGASPARLTIPSGQDGSYFIFAMGTFQVGMGTGVVQLVLKKNGTEIRRGSVFGANTTYLLNPAIVYVPLYELNAGDYLELFAEIEHHVASPAFTLYGGVARTFMQIARLG